MSVPVSNALIQLNPTAQRSDHCEDLHFECEGSDKHSRQEHIVSPEDATAAVSEEEFRSSREVYLKRPVAILD